MRNINFALFRYEIIYILSLTLLIKEISSIEQIPTNKNIWFNFDKSKKIIAITKGREEEREREKKGERLREGESK